MGDVKIGNKTYRGMVSLVKKSLVGRGKFFSGCWWSWAQLPRSITNIVNKKELQISSEKPKKGRIYEIEPEETGSLLAPLPHSE